MTRPPIIGSNGISTGYIRTFGGGGTGGEEDGFLGTNGGAGGAINLSSNGPITISADVNSSGGGIRPGIGS